MRLRGRPLAVWLLLAVLAQLSVRALLGGSALVLAPSGDLVGLASAELDPLALEDFRLPGLVLWCVLGVYPALVGYWILVGRERAWLAALSVGAALFVWLAVETVAGFERPTLALNLATAVATVALAVHPSVRRVSDGESDTDA